MRIDSMERQWDNIRSRLKTLPPAVELRPRCTLLQTIWDLELTDELTERVIRRLHKRGSEILGYGGRLQQLWGD